MSRKDEAMATLCRKKLEEKESGVGEIRPGLGNDLFFEHEGVTLSDLPGVSRVGSSRSLPLSHQW